MTTALSSVSENKSDALYSTYKECTFQRSWTWEYTYWPVLKIYSKSWCWQTGDRFKLRPGFRRGLAHRLHPLFYKKVHLHMARETVLDLWESPLHLLLPLSPKQLQSPISQESRAMIRMWATSSLRSWVQFYTFFRNLLWKKLRAVVQAGHLPKLRWVPGQSESP